MDNKNVYNTEKVVAEYLSSDYILKPEQTILKRVVEMKLSTMLDIGVGAGRTTKYFAPFFKAYHGVDYSENMVSECIKRFHKSENISFSLADARDMQKFKDNEFDFTLFSFNGIDCVGLNERNKVLSEIFRVGKNGGCFAFSFHNMYNLPKLFSYQLPKNPLKWIREYKRVNGVKSKNLPVAELLSNDAAEIIDGDLDFSTSYVYIKPQFQIEELAKIGFKVLSSYKLSSDEEIPIHTDWAKISDPWIYLFCRIEK